MKRIKITNALGRDGSVQFGALAKEPPVTTGIPGHQVSFRRYLASTEACRHSVLKEQFGEDYAQKLLNDDPEVDIEHVGRLIEETNVVYLNAKGEFLHSPPNVIEIITAADGAEKERRKPVDIASNVDGEYPLRWSGRKFPIRDAVRRFAFRRSIQLSHVDGVTYDFLFSMASELAKENVLMLIGAGPKGLDPLIFQANGRPSRGFLQGMIDGQKYRLLLHLSDMELKKPAPNNLPASQQGQQ